MSQADYFSSPFHGHCSRKLRRLEAVVFNQCTFTKTNFDQAKIYHASFESPQMLTVEQMKKAIDLENAQFDDAAFATSLGLSVASGASATTI